MKTAINAEQLKTRWMAMATDSMGDLKGNWYITLTKQHQFRVRDRPKNE